MKSKSEWKETDRIKIAQIDYSKISGLRIDEVEFYNPETKKYCLIIQKLLGNPDKDDWTIDNESEILKEESQKIIKN